LAPDSQSADRTVFAELLRTGLILQSDPLLPNVAAIVAGETITGSWWGHRKGHEIFTVLKHLNSHPDALVTRLVSGKVTYLHRRLWPDFLSIAMAHDDWQTTNLSRAGRQLQSLVQKRGELRMDKIAARRNFPVYTRAAKEIEGRLLVYSDELHTETGAHAKVLMTWSKCPKLLAFRRQRRSTEEARRTFDAVVSGLNRACNGKATLPWWPAMSAGNSR
jgi:hypothetical protein